MVLLERDPVFERMDAQLGHARQGEGRVVVLRGEAGIGKTSVVREFCDTHREDVHVLWGGCDDLLTPQPLGPIWDMTFDEPALEELLLSDRRQRVFHAVYELLGRSLRPTVMVIEDVHWADESTVDLITYVGRRVDQTHGLLILTYRDDALVRDHPIQFALGDLPRGASELISLEPLTETAVSQLAGDVWDVEELWRLTDGNPFFITELVQTGRMTVPGSIRDALRARMLRLTVRGRELVELVSVVPGGADLSLVEEIIHDARDLIKECEEVGILEIQGNNLAFRHELARRAVEDELPEIRRRELNLAILEAVDARDEDVALRAHFAREAGDASAVLRLLPLAARRSADLGSHREALSHLRALEPFLDGMDLDQLANHYDLWAHEELLAGGTAMVGLVEKAVQLHRRLGDSTSLGKTLLLASEIYWWNEKREPAVELAEEAVSVLESVGGEALAMAYSTLSRWAMVASDAEKTLYYAEKALDQLDDNPSPACVHALNNRGSILAVDQYPDGFDDLYESYRMAEALELPSHQARAAHNIGSAFLMAGRDIQQARRWENTALQLVEGAEMPGLRSAALSELAWIDELVGDWDAAKLRAQSVLQDPSAGIHQVIATCVLGRILTRTGDPDAQDVAVDAWKRARRSNEAQRLGPSGAVVCELAWLGTNLDQALIAEIVSSFKSDMSNLLFSELAFWLSTMGHIDRVPDSALEPFVLLDGGRWEEAAAFWNERGIPYERALSLSFGDTEAKLEALTTLDQLGATPLGDRVRRELQSAGVKGVPRGPSAATRDSPLGLTPRQTEVLELLAEGLTNAEIAERLFVSTRTIDHHVSAILSKLGVDDRTDAVAKARETDLRG